MGAQKKVSMLIKVHALQHNGALTVLVCLQVGSTYMLFLQLRSSEILSEEPFKHDIVFLLFSSFLTAGEDGFVKVWSRNGLLRSTIVQSDIPCYNAVWNPDSSAILYTKGNFLVMKQLNSSNKITKVRKHYSVLTILIFQREKQFAVKEIKKARCILFGYRQRIS